MNLNTYQCDKVGIDRTLIVREVTADELLGNNIGRCEDLPPLKRFYFIDDADSLFGPLTYGEVLLGS